MDGDGSDLKSTMRTLLSPTVIALNTKTGHLLFTAEIPDHAMRSMMRLSVLSLPCWKWDSRTGFPQPTITNPKTSRPWPSDAAPPWASHIPTSTTRALIRKSSKMPNRPFPRMWFNFTTETSSSGTGNLGISEIRIRTNFILERVHFSFTGLSLYPKVRRTLFPKSSPPISSRGQAYKGDSDSVATWR